MARAPKKVRDAVEELKDWFENVDPESEYPKIVLRILASVPGGEDAEDVGFVPIDGMGWKEFDLLGQLIDAIQSKDDVEYAVGELLGDEE